MRSGDEITDMWYEKRMAPKNIRTLNPAFDVTDNSLITAFITERVFSLRMNFDTPKPV